MLKTEFYRWAGDQQVLIGSLNWDGQEVFAAPASEEYAPILEEIMEEGVGVGGEIYTKDNPKMFLRTLYTKYKSAYFSATRAQDDSQQPVPEQINPPEPTLPTESEQPTLFAEPLAKTPAPVISDRPKKKVVEEEFDRDPKTGLITKRRITTIEEE